MKSTRLSYILLPAAMFAVISIAPTSTFAQVGLGPNTTVIASGLQGPRGLKFGPDGMLYVAEAGTGGTTFTTPSQCQQVPGPVGPYSGGNNSGRISRIDKNGNRTTVATGFPSAVDAMGDLLGVADVAFLNGQLYAVTAGGGCSHGNLGSPNVIAKVNIATGAWFPIANLSTFVQAHPTDYPNAADFEPDGTWYGMITVGDRLFAVEPNRGEVISSDVNGNLRRDLDVSRTEGHVVPYLHRGVGGIFLFRQSWPLSHYSGCLARDDLFPGDRTAGRDPSAAGPLSRVV